MKFEGELIEPSEHGQLLVGRVDEFAFGNVRSEKHQVDFGAVGQFFVPQ